MPALTLAVLGPFEARLGDEPLSRFRTSRVQALLVFLAVESPRAHVREQLVDLLWPGLPQRSAAENLRQTLYQLRRAIPSVLAKASGTEVPLLETDRRTVRLNPAAAIDLDADRFRTLTRHDATPGNLDAAAALYRGDFLAGFSLPDSNPFEDWAQTQRAAFRREAQAALSKLAALALMRPDYAAAEAYARRQLALDDLSEDACRQLIEALALAGRRSLALAEAEACRRRPMTELGVAPEPRTEALVEAIAAGRLSAPELGGALAASPAAEAEPATVASEAPPFVGRQRELRRLQAGLAQALAGHGGMLFVTGEAGRGKTALLTAFGRGALEIDPHVVVASGYCTAYAGAGDPYLPFRDVLGVLTGASSERGPMRVVAERQAPRLRALRPAALQAIVEHAPDLVDVFVSAAELKRQSRALPQNAPWLPALEALSQRARSGPAAGQPSTALEQFTGLLRGLAAQRPLIIILDDLQWADGASINLLFHLGRRLAGSRILLVGAYRLSDVAVGRRFGDMPDGPHPLRAVAGELARQWGDIQIDLGLDTPSEGREFVEALLDASPNRLDTEFRGAFFERTKGHALFAVELLRDLQLRGVLRRDEEGLWVRAAALDWGQLPARVEAVIAQRLNQLPVDLRAILSAASVEGEEFTIQVLARAVGRPEREVVAALAVLEREYHLVHGQGGGRLGSALVDRAQFAHVLFQQFLCDALTPAERRVLHAEVAAALEELYGPAAQEAAATLAYHHAEAGQARQAVTYLLLAGDRARVVYAHQAAARHYQQALPLLRILGDAEAEARTQLKLGLVFTIAFDHARARESYDAGFALWQAVGAGRPVPHLPPAPHPFRLVWRDPESLDPTMAGTNLEAPIVTQLLCGLVNQSPEMEVVPDVAERWEVLDDGRRYVFHLRRDVFWTDGMPVSAGDFEFTFKRALDPATRAPVAGMLLHPIRGALDFNTGRAPDATEVGIYAPDPHTLVLELDAPCSYLLPALSYYVLCPVPRHVVLAHGAAWAQPPHFVGNGPFTLETWTRGAGMRLARNPHYHGRFDGNLDGVYLHPAVPPEQEFDLYAAGELDLLHNWFYLSALIDAPRRRHPAEYSTQPRYAAIYYVVDVTQPPFDDARVRRALAMVLDRPAIIRQLSGDYELPGVDGFVPPGMPGHSPGIGLPYSPDEARRLLAAAGFADGRGLSTLELLVSASREALARVVAEAWRRELGWEVRVQVATGSMLEMMSLSRPHVALAGWWADYADPDNFLRVCVQLDVPAWREPAYEQLLDQARHLTDQAARMRCYQEGDRLLMLSGVVVPMLYGRAHLLLKPWVRAFQTNAIKNPGFWKDVILEPH